MEQVNPEPGSRDGVPPRIAYVLGTTAGGTGPHVAMLAQGLSLIHISEPTRPY